jgi:hypothetical protein
VKLSILLLVVGVGVVEMPVRQTAAVAQVDLEPVLD